MPISLLCPGCTAKINAPDASAGKKIRCPKCKTICNSPVALPASAFEMVDESELTPNPKPTQPSAKASTDEVEDGFRNKHQSSNNEERTRREKRPGEEEVENRAHRKKKPARNEDDDQPGKRKGKRDNEERAGHSRALIAGIIVGVLLLAGGSFAVYWFAFGRKPAGSVTADGATVNLEDWEVYTSSDNVFKVSFPGKSSVSQWKPVTDLKVTSDIRDFTIGEKSLGKPSLSFFAGFVRFPDGVTPGEVEKTTKWYITCAAPATQGMFKEESNDHNRITVNSRQWDQIRMNSGPSSGVFRCHQSGSILYVLGCRCEQQQPPKGILEKFLASFEILGGEPADPDPVKLDNWQSYVSTDGVFKVSFPAETKKMGNYFFESASRSEFRQCDLKEENSLKRRSYFAGYVTFAKKPIPKDIHEVVDFVKGEALGLSPWSQRRVAVGGWPWGVEQRSASFNARSFNPRDFSITLELGGGIVRWVEVGSTIYACGMKNSILNPADKEIKKFFESFEILNEKPNANDLKMPPDWVEYKAPTGEFRARMPRHLSKQVDPFKTGNNYAGVPIVSITEYKGHDLAVEHIVYVVRFVPNTSDADKQKIMDILAKRKFPGDKLKPETTKKITWSGREGLEHTFSPSDVCITRQTNSDTVAYIAVVVTKFSTFNSDLSKVFLDSISFDGGAVP